MKMSSTQPWKLALLLCAHLATFASSEVAEREHKVHNIVLYPERHSWCTTTPIKQIVSLPDFDPITIDNNVCVGACYSYSIPHTQPAEPGELIGPYCDSCQPKETKCYHVTFQSATKTVQKRVQIIMNCTCLSCTKQLDAADCDLDDVNTSELPTNLRSMKKDNQDARPEVSEIPELLSVGSAPIVNSTEMGQTHHKHTPSRTYHINDNIRSLLEQIRTLSEESEDSEEDDDAEDTSAILSKLDHERMTELVDLVEGSDRRLTDKDVMEFVNYVNEHLDLELDSLKLKSTLVAFKEAAHREELRTRHRNFGLGLNQVDVKQPDGDLPIITGIEGSHLGMVHKKGAHIGMGMRNHQISDNTINHDDDADAVELSTENVHETGGNHGNSHVHHHKLGEEQHLIGGVGHLVMGPHGSLVVAPDAPKLNLASDEIAPNQEGLVIDYHHNGAHHHAHHGAHHGGHPHSHAKHVEEIVSQPGE